MKVIAATVSIFIVAFGDIAHAEDIVNLTCLNLAGSQIGDLRNDRIYLDIDKARPAVTLKDRLGYVFRYSNDVAKHFVRLDEAAISFGEEKVLGGGKTIISHQLNRRTLRLDGEMRDPSVAWPLNSFSYQCEVQATKPRI